LVYKLQFKLCRTGNIGRPVAVKDANVMITSTADYKDGDKKVHPVHALFGYVPNWFLLGTVRQKPHYASWSISSEALEQAEGKASEETRQNKRAKPHRTPMRIQIVKTRFCTYIIER
jgi:hypothetical protein